MQPYDLYFNCSLFPLSNNTVKNTITTTSFNNRPVLIESTEVAAEHPGIYCISVVQYNAGGPAAAVILCGFMGQTE